MQPVKVRTNDEYIVIEQEQYPEEPVGVVIHPTQLPTLIKWLQEAAAEFEGR